MSLTTPIAFFIFNRPDLTTIVFEAIRKAKPQQLLIIADGPRCAEEQEKCEAARSVIQQVDWECELLTNFSKTNLGCKRRVSSGLDWVFEVCEEAIILEDDCLPTASFFSFCETLLAKYRHNQQIMMISGSNFQPYSRTWYSYYFSKYTHIWGWATWRRAWQHYDVEMSSWSESNTSSFLKNHCEHPYEKAYWKQKFDSVAQGTLDTWDYQWLYACWLRNGLAILPNKNLVSNIGFRADATHTLEQNWLSDLKTQDIENIKHPPFIIRNRQADHYTLKTVFNVKRPSKIMSIFGKIKKHFNINYDY